MIAAVDPVTVSKFAKENGIKDDESLLDNMTLKQYVMGSVLDLSKKNKLLANEKPKYIYLTKEPFSVDNGLVTPTLKLKRNFAK